jgi:hypothetical protein
MIGIAIAVRSRNSTIVSHNLNGTSISRRSSITAEENSSWLMDNTAIQNFAATAALVGTYLWVKLHFLSP